MGLLAIDPGTKYCGWASFHCGLIQQWGTVKAAKDLDWLERCKIITEAIIHITHDEDSDELVIEQPRTYAGQEGARNSDAILKLALLVGMIAGRAIGEGLTVNLVPVEKWKGQVPKEITRKRMAARWKINLVSDRSDAVDAIGLGTYWLNNRRKYAKNKIW